MVKSFPTTGKRYMVHMMMTSRRAPLKSSCWYAHWQLPSSHSFLMRVYNRETNKVREYAYKQDHHARKRLLKECQDADNEIVLCDNYSIHLIKQADESDHD